MASRITLIIAFICLTNALLFDKDIISKKDLINTKKEPKHKHHTHHTTRHPKTSSSHHEKQERVAYLEEYAKEGPENQFDTCEKDEYGFPKETGEYSHVEGAVTTHTKDSKTKDGKKKGKESKNTVKGEATYSNFNNTKISDISASIVNEKSKTKNGHSIDNKNIVSGRAYSKSVKEGENIHTDSMTEAKTLSSSTKHGHTEKSENIGAAKSSKDTLTKSKQDDVNKDVKDNTNEDLENEILELKKKEADKKIESSNSDSKDCKSKSK